MHIVCRPHSSAAVKRCACGAWQCSLFCDEKLCRACMQALSTREHGLTCTCPPERARNPAPCASPLAIMHTRSVHDDARLKARAKRLQACGSGATTAGIAAANHLAGYGAEVLGFGVCDDEDYFYEFIDGLLQDWAGHLPPARALVRMVQAKGAGYAMSRCGPCSSRQLLLACWLGGCRRVRHARLVRKARRHGALLLNASLCDWHACMQLGVAATKTCWTAHRLQRIAMLGHSIVMSTISARACECPGKRACWPLGLPHHGTQLLAGMKNCSCATASRRAQGLCSTLCTLARRCMACCKTCSSTPTAGPMRGCCSSTQAGCWACMRKSTSCSQLWRRRPRCTGCDCESRAWHATCECDWAAVKMQDGRLPEVSDLVSHALLHVTTVAL